MKNDPSPNSRKGKKGGPGVRVYMICRVHKYVEYRENVLLCHSPPPFSKIRKRILKKEMIMMMIQMDDDTYNMMHIKGYTYG